MSTERAAFRKILNPLCAMFRVQFDIAQWTVYFQALSDISLALLDGAVVLASRDHREFMPRPGELRAYAEQARVARLAASPWQPCVNCEPLKGFIETTDGEGVKRLAKCGCLKAHADLLAAAGIPSHSLIKAPRPQREDDAAWEAVEPVDPGRIPRALAGAVKGIARAHRMPSAPTPQTDLDGRPLPERHR